ncbi:hypothetical protein HDF22_001446 [Mucilaginibacter lappiensis]|uniref:Uncharacterized protein n=1 Tax=Mucilaginibacter lappiensis TaxID=354630 RepID=A0A841J9A0_9SPHI|nr:hypothetical protein [Mucilaginibacter lappiensis]
MVCNQQIWGCQKDYKVGLHILPLKSTQISEYQLNKQILTIKSVNHVNPLFIPAPGREPLGAGKRLFYRSSSPLEGNRTISRSFSSHLRSFGDGRVEAPMTVHDSFSLFIP